MGFPYKKDFRISNPFGVKGGWAAGWHIGIDLVGTDKNIYPIESGTVIKTGYDKSYGNYIRIYHGTRISHYAHLSKINVITGDSVTTNTCIGVEGSTGNSTGSHLHLEIHKGNWKYPSGLSQAQATWIENPANYFGIKNVVGTVKVTKEEEMTQAEFNKMMNVWLEKHNPYYKDIANVPKYWRDDVRQMVKEGIIKGESDKVHVGMRRETLKAVIVAYRFANGKSLHKDLK